MASTGMKYDDSRPASEATPPENDSSANELCELCLRALTINDQLVGGTTRVNTSNGTTSLDLSGFVQNNWGLTEHCQNRGEQKFDIRREEDRNASGWTTDVVIRTDQGMRTEQHRRSCAGDQHERLVTLPCMREIYESAAGTCRFCSKLRALFIEQYAKSPWWNEHGSTLRFTIQYEWIEYRIKLGGEDEAASLPHEQILEGLAVLVVHPGHVVNKRDCFSFDVVAWPGPCKEWLTIENGPLDPDGPTSDRNIGFMRHCIDKCVSEHPKCTEKSFKPKFVPKRLLDLGGRSASSAKLVECGESLSLPYPEPPRRYATLSYCWGSSLTMTTTTANKSKHETTGIEICDMPGTFQDAIYVAKMLGIRYLWIDALCIIQDDQDDWETEAVTMCDVFAHSRVTISAARTASSAHHFLQRPVDEILTFIFHSTLKPDVSGQYSVRLEPRHSSPAERDVGQSTWRSRAWVWQEEIMSTRQVVFGNKTMQFRCGQGIFLEDGRCESDPFMELHPSIFFWSNAVNIYSSRTLTYASDRLKAIAGVAKFIESFYHMDGNPTKYLVGLWKNGDFPSQIRWICKEPSLSRTELMGLLRDSRRYIAPSWSWASRNTGVDCDQVGYDTAIRVIKADLRPSHTTAMVSVAFGSSITLSGKVCQTPVEPSSGHLVPDAGRWEASSTYGRTDFWLDWVPKKNDDEESKFQRQLCLLLTTVMDLAGRKSIGGLILTPVVHPIPEAGVMFYYRVGVFEHFGHSKMLTSMPREELTIR